MMQAILIFAVIMIVAYIFVVAWMVRRAHGNRMEMADIAKRMLSEDSDLNEDERELVAFLVSDAYSARAMIGLLRHFPAAFFGMLFPSESARTRFRTSAMGRLLERKQGHRLFLLYERSVMVANLPLSFIFLFLYSISTPFLLVKGEDTRRTAAKAVEQTIWASPVLHQPFNG